MREAVPFDTVPCGLAVALEDRGFKDLTEIQQAVLDPSVAGRDLRVSSKTGSGKTVAVGFAVAEGLGELRPKPRGKRPVAMPQALLVAPTRELAAQIGKELGWLFRPLGARIAVVTGGTNMGGDFRTLAAGPHVLVGTPGRLVDHVGRGSLDLSATHTVVLDEADEMLDMGFRDDLELLLESTPEDRSTHLVSATFPREVLRLANRFQNDAVLVEGSPAGKPNQDIAHVGLTVNDRDKVSALINVLLAGGKQRTLVFVRTRVGTANLATELSKNGFSAAALSGEMGQRERTTTLEAFRAGVTDILVATDVAARGLDIDSVAQVVHFDMPENGEVFTHRSGRTGRAGNKGTSLVLVHPRGRNRAQAMFRRLGVSIDWQKIPTPEQIKQAADKRLLAELETLDENSDRELAQKLLEQHEAADIIAALLARINHQGPCAPREIRDAVPQKSAGKMGQRKGSRPHRGSGDFTPFHVTWGAMGGANPSRLLAMVCRRGDLRGKQIGAIKVTEFSSVVEVCSSIAADFAKAAQRPDPRNPKIRIRPWRDNQPHRGGGAKKPHRGSGPKKRNDYRRSA